jgi:hypothetical protein
MRALKRFGTVVGGPRRWYQVERRAGGYCPLDERLGAGHCSGSTPRMARSISMFSRKKHLRASSSNPDEGQKHISRI